MTLAPKDLRTIDAWVVDVDGCLVSTDRAGGSGGEPISGAVGFLRAVRESGHTLRVVTNASQSTPHRYAEHLRDMGFDIRDEEFMTAGSAAAAYLASQHGGQRVLAVAEAGIIEPLRALGVDSVTDDPRGVGAVVVGAVADLPMTQLNAACRAVADNAAPLYVTVDSPWFHGGRGRSVCTSAAIAHAIAWVTGAEPIVLGKPSAAIAATLRTQLGADACIAVVGDAPAEIALAREMGACAITVLTGALDRARLDAASQRGDGPDLVVDSVADLTSLFPTSPTSARV